MTIAELAEGAERLLHEVRTYAAKRKERDGAAWLAAARYFAAEFPPSGCHDCGATERVHAAASGGYPDCREYVTPTDDQIKARMLARRYSSGQHATTTDMEK